MPSNTISMDPQKEVTVTATDRASLDMNEIEATAAVQVVALAMPLVPKQVSVGKGRSWPPDGAHKHGTPLFAATQTQADIERFDACRRKTAAFEEWRLKLNLSDRLPRGRFFKGKRPGRKLVVMDEFWQAFNKGKLNANRGDS
uniref:Uncharacterized protein n=1 Tax=Pseudomonas fluorescens (strain SBW25) TaxID=216595 RepID=A4V7M5_PSEFS|nr:hypothetical protein [Pseudomonas fluorescens]CAM96147.1 hypothetical protein pQBR0115 [Pseudomonas fluorescens SBW25]